MISAFRDDVPVGIAAVIAAHAGEGPGADGRQTPNDVIARLQAVGWSKVPPPTPEELPEPPLHASTAISTTQVAHIHCGNHVGGHALEDPCKPRSNRGPGGGIIVASSLPVICDSSLSALLQHCRAIDHSIRRTPAGFKTPSKLFQKVRIASVCPAPAPRPFGR